MKTLTMTLYMGECREVRYYQISHSVLGCIELWINP